MSNRTYICIECRTAKRADAAYGLNTKMRCSQCRKSLFELPWRWRIPGNADDSGWKALSKFVAEIDREFLPRRYAEGQRLMNKIDAQIEATLRRKDSEGKESKLKYLRWKRREIESEYTEPVHGGDT